VAAARALKAAPPRWLWLACFYAWLLLLVVPSMTTFTSTYSWDASPYYLLAVTVWLFGLAWFGLGPRGFFVATYPLALFSVLFLAADYVRGANLLELAMVSGGFMASETSSAVRPYIVPMALVALVLVFPVWVAWRFPHEPNGRNPKRLVLVPVLGLLGAGLLWAAPATFLRAWPINVLSLGVATTLGRTEFISTALPWAPVNARKPGGTWSAHRTGAAPKENETYVLVIGESVRADRLQACGYGRPIAMTTPAIVYCDVMASSSSTHTAVPLLVSREMPGSTLRVSQDATFLKAFEESGFRTYWLSVQGPTIAWPDAQVERYAFAHTTDREDLLPLFRAALDEPGPRKLIVLHAYNAHAEYCFRYKAPGAVVPTGDCAVLGNVMTYEKREAWRDAYDNAVAESLAFLDAVAAELDARPGQSFMAYTPDHGENLMDDDRLYFAHSLKEPTRFDTRVPFIFWANGAWREANGPKWELLRANAGAKAMHVDLVPTMLGAASITYAEPRQEPVDLTRVSPPARTRWVMQRLGVVVDGDTLK
jgi:glucan phosphoethanolaminetransferase (alkaline phosphatase superfamily)